MSALNTLTRITGATVVTMAALTLTAGPSTAQTQSTPASGSSTAAAVTSSSDSGINWTDVGSGALAGVALAGGAFAASTALRRRQQPNPA